MLFMDRYEGSNIYKALKAIEGMDKEFDGFTYYPNTMSISDITLSSIAAVLGGHKYEPINMNKLAKNENKTISELIEEAYILMPKAFHQKGYDVSYFAPDYASYDKKNIELQKYANISYKSNAYANFYIKRHGAKSVLGKSQNIDSAKYLSMVSLFKMTPFFIKSEVYQEGRWHILNLSSVIGKNFNLVMPELGFMDSLSVASNTNSDKPTFKMFHSELTHFPHILSKDCKIVSDKFPDDSVKDSSKGKNPWYTAKCTAPIFINYFKWLKREGIYDNTKIIIMSDHGDWAQNNHMLESTTIKGNGIAKTLYQPAFIVKDFKSHGKMKIDYRFMSNADVPAIICSAIGKCEGIDDIDTTKTLLKNRKVIGIKRRLKYKDANRNYNWNILYGFEVTDSIFKDKNWRNMNKSEFK